MTNANPGDHLVTSGAAGYGGAEVLITAGQTMAIYLPDATQNLIVDLSSLNGECRVRWFDPRTGDQVEGEGTVVGGSTVQLPIVPSDRNLDWLVLIELR